MNAVKKKRVRRPVEKLLFIDTNIMLDFYRQTPEAHGVLLGLIDDNQSKIICTNQIEMEFKKHRVDVLMDRFKALKEPSWESLTPPAFLADSEPATILKTLKGNIKKQRTKLLSRIEACLVNSQQDEVYGCLQRLFKNAGYFLRFDDFSPEDEHVEVYRRARVRFERGFPPRKNSDTSYGDAINWEWILKTAKNRNCDVIIVSRDRDYGTELGSKFVINDWLRNEFKFRVNKQRNIVLTNKLSSAFKMINVSVSGKVEKEEAEMIQRKEQETSYEQILKHQWAGGEPMTMRQLAGLDAFDIEKPSK